MISRQQDKELLLDLPQLELILHYVLRFSIKPLQLFSSQAILVLISKVLRDLQLQPKLQQMLAHDHAWRFNIKLQRLLL